MAKEEEVLEEVQEGPKTDGFVTGVVVVTTLVLLVAFIIMELALKEYGLGLFKG
jgi:hypothetical protein